MDKLEDKLDMIRHWQPVLRAPEELLDRERLARISDKTFEKEFAIYRKAAGKEQQARCRRERIEKIGMRGMKSTDNGGYSLLGIVITPQMIEYLNDPNFDQVLQNLDDVIASARRSESYFRTFTETPEWVEWVEYQSFESHQYDVVESMELGLISKEHMRAFFDWIEENYKK